MVKRCRALVKSSGVPGVGIPEKLKVKVMAKLVAESAEKRSERGDMIANGGPHPNADQFGFRIVIAKDLRGPSAFSGPDGSGRENKGVRRFDFVEPSEGAQKFAAGLANGSDRRALE